MKMKKTYIIAEIGMTHDGSLGLASKLTESAIKSGANVIKYQWHIHHLRLDQLYFE